jgi:alpha-ketoglutarate-dependent 2,4-dichlorophenoxyacetate dioxygenase
MFEISLPMKVTSRLSYSSLWHSRKLASPFVFGNPLPHELAAKPPAYHRLVQTAPDGRKTLYLAAHAKRIVGKDIEESQRLIWELIDHCTQGKVSSSQPCFAKHDR